MQIELTQGKFAIIDDDDLPKISGRKWQYCNGYAVSGSQKKENQLRMHRVIMGLSYGDNIWLDHINGNRLDNRKSNLRITDASSNQANRKAPKVNTSGYKGVVWHKGKNKWMAACEHMGKMIFIGYFKDKILAAEAYDKKAAEIWGEFAGLNFPGDQQ